MSRAVMLHEYGERGNPPVLVNVEHVGMVMPRRNHTTLAVAGTYVHVIETSDQVLGLLGWTGNGV